MSLLVFDDSATVGRLIVRIAGLSGITATAVTDSESFAERLWTDRPSIVVLDLELGATSRVEQLRLAAEQHCTSAIVLMSGHDARVLAAAGALGRSLGLNIDSTLKKPLRVAELEQILERLQFAALPHTGADSGWQTRIAA